MLGICGRQRDLCITAHRVKSAPDQEIDGVAVQRCCRWQVKNNCRALHRFDGKPHIALKRCQTPAAR